MAANSSEPQIKCCLPLRFVVCGENLIFAANEIVCRCRSFFCHGNLVFAAGEIEFAANILSLRQRKNGQGVFKRGNALGCMCGATKKENGRSRVVCGFSGEIAARVRKAQRR